MPTRSHENPKSYRQTGRRVTCQYTFRRKIWQLPARHNKPCKKV
ncbi:MAG: hypothetical protein [Siphoviridae sp. ctvD11]|nr:MAG: hypothetical protein [Siphoviridae sp. ctvD11]